MARIDLYFRTQLETKVSLRAEQANGSMDDHLLDNLKTKVEKKVMENGIVLKVIKLIDYDYGIIDKVNFMGTTVFSVRYECFVCSPTKDLEIICVVENIVKGYLIARNGPLKVVIQFNNVDAQKFEISEGTIISSETKVPIQKKDYLRVSIIGINSNLGEESITTMCKLVSIATKEEIREFKRDQKIVIGDDLDTDREFI